jgi:hypothetical protein
MSSELKKQDDSSLMKFVQAIAISPEDARVVVKQYEAQIREAEPDISDLDVQNIIVDKIVSRYSKLAAASGGATSLPGIIPGVGTAVSAVGGSMADISACIKFQVDMTMCLAIAINKELNNEDAKHLSFIIALSGTLEQGAKEGAAKLATKASVRLIQEHLKGATLTIIKELFKRVGIVFTKKAAVKVIPFGIGVLVGAGFNYTLTKYVGKIAIDTLRIHKDEMGSS